ALGLIRVLTDLPNWTAYVIGFFAVSAPLYLLYIITKGRGIGGGDIKLMAAAGLLLGWKLAVIGFLLGCILGSVIHVVRMRLSSAEHVLAMGPYLSAGIFIAALWGDRMLAWYLSLY
ncbi:MAG: prepilin peptidase, partial [Lachnospiraceae bacterium]|nr:prepilin peptidase [Lachnospiraceae bacterium]